jgi:hypothetical protein
MDPSQPNCRMGVPHLPGDCDEPLVEDADPVVRGVSLGYPLPPVRDD